MLAQYQQVLADLDAGARAAVGNWTGTDRDLADGFGPARPR